MLLSRVRQSWAAYWAALAILSATLILVALAAMCAGPVHLGPREVLAALGGDGTGVPEQIVRSIRLPRVLLGAMVGGSLAVVGGTLQAVMRNPLADPYLLGVSSGASIGAALASLLGLSAGVLGGLATTALAFATATASVAIVYAIARVDGAVPALRLLLAGVAYSSFAMALSSFLLFLAPEASQVRSVVFWLMGTLSQASWTSVGWSTLGLLPSVTLLLLTFRWQNVLVFGDEAAETLGLEVTRSRRALILLTALATGTTVAFAGAIGFIGLIVPHALRPLVGPDHRRLLPASLLVGATILVGMDGLARSLLAPEEIPVGILTGLLGAPFFMVLLGRARGAGVSH